MNPQTPYPVEPTGASVARRLAGLIASAAMVAAPVVGAAVALAVAANAALTVARLFARLGADVPSQALAGAATVGVLAALTGVMVLARSANLRALSVMFGIAWLPVTLALVALEAALSSAIVAVPAALAESGRILAALLAGLALLPVVTLAAASRRPDPGDLAGALGYYIGNTLKVILLGATAGANVAFGISRGVPLEVSLFVAVALETAFILAMTRAQRGALHALALVTFGGALAIVAVETMSVLSGLASLPQLARIGEALYLLTPALAIAYIVATALADRHGRSEAAPRIRILRGMAGHIREARDGLAEVRAALAGERRERLPEPAPTPEPATVFSANGHSAPAEVGAGPKSE